MYPRSNDIFDSVRHYVSLRVWIRFIGRNQKKIANPIEEQKRYAYDYSVRYGVPGFKAIIPYKKHTADVRLNLK